MKASLLRVTGSVASVVSSLVLFGGVASAQTTSATITDTGRDSTNIIEINDKCEVIINNNNEVVIVNNNTQHAESGDATVGGSGSDAHQVNALTENTDNHENEGGNEVSNVSTGDATNTNTTGINVNIDNRANISCVINQQMPPAGGSGGGAPVVTPAEVHVPAPVQAGGSGAGEQVFVPVARQVSTMPVGGVGAGEGGVEYLTGLAAITLLSGALATRRLNRAFRS